MSEHVRRNIPSTINEILFFAGKMVLRYHFDNIFVEELLTNKQTG